LTDRFRVVRVVRRQYRLDLPGGCSIAQEVEHVVALAKALDPPVLLFGHSSGAVVALEAVLTSPALFTGVVLYEPPLVIGPPLGGEAARSARAALAAGAHRKAATIFLCDIVGQDPDEAALRASSLASNPQSRPLISRQIDDVDAIDALACRLDAYAEIDLPAVLLGGAHSPAHHGLRLDALHARLPKAKRIVLVRSGHGANVSAPGEVARVIETTASSLLA